MKLVIYGSEMEKREQELLEHNGKYNNNKLEPQFDIYQDSVLEDEYDGEFWLKVASKQRNGLSWSRAMDVVTVETMIQNVKESGELEDKDPVLLMFKQWPQSKKYQDNFGKLPGLEQKTNRLLEIMLESELNSSNEYQTFRDEEDNTRRTLLHYAAELGYLYVTKTLAKKCPGLLILKTEQTKEKRSMLPVELALEAENDEVAAYLIRAMWHERYND